MYIISVIAVAAIIYGALQWSGFTHRGFALPSNPLVGKIALGCGSGILGVILLIIAYNCSKD